MGKRGQFSAVAKIVLLVLFAVLIIFAVGRFVLFILSQSADTVCAQSIIKSGFDGVPSFDCKAEKITISRDSLETGAGGKLDESGLDDATKQAVANELYSCWKNTGKGMVDPYRKSYEAPAQTVGYGTRDIFLICKIVKFQDVPSFNGLFFWMTINKPQGGDEPYFDTVYNRKPTDDEITEFEKKGDNYDTSRTYAVVWRYTAHELSSKVEQSIVFVPYDDMVHGKTGYTPILMN